MKPPTVFPSTFAHGYSLGTRNIHSYCTPQIRWSILWPCALFLSNSERKDKGSLGAILLQRQPDGEMKPGAFVSRPATSTEIIYARLRKRPLPSHGIVSTDYLVGLRFHIQTDHKPLVPLFSSKNLDYLPLRIQRFRLKMLRFDFTIAHVRGKLLAIADTLLRAPISSGRSRGGIQGCK